MHPHPIIRPFASHADYEACVELQLDIWGRDFKETVSSATILVAQKIGGIAAGGFDSEGKLLGFVFGMTGIKDDVIVHWSDMLAVRPTARNLGLGRRLKEFQRQAAARIGAEVMYWTYDPLVAKNAHLNFNVFGVRAAEYARDLYGHKTSSDLHRGIGTDRLVVAWPLDDAELSERRQETLRARNAKSYRSALIMGDAERVESQSSGSLNGNRCLRIAIPLDIELLQALDVARAGRWRWSTRLAFEVALEAGYRVDGFYSDIEQDRGFYLLSQSA